MLAIHFSFCRHPWFKNCLAGCGQNFAAEFGAICVPPPRISGWFQRNSEIRGKSWPVIPGFRPFLCMARSIVET
jgi:hypothetical protein